MLRGKKRERSAYGCWRISRSRLSFRIKEKLISRGYAQEVEYLSAHRFIPGLVEFKRHHHVKPPKPLTERSEYYYFTLLVRCYSDLSIVIVWSRIEDEILGYILAVRKYRLEEEKKSIHTARRQELSQVWLEWQRNNLEPTEFSPGQVDLWLWDKATNIIERPLEEKVTQDTFRDALLPSFSSFIQKWREDVFDLRKTGQVNEDTWWRHDFRDSVMTCHHETFEVVKDHYEDKSRLLELAVCVYTCEDDMDLHRERESYDEKAAPYGCMWYPEFLHHACNSITPRWLCGDDVSVLDRSMHASLQLRSGWKYGCIRKKWDTKMLHFDYAVSGHVKQILIACGLEWNKTKTSELDELDPRIVCLKCSFGNVIDGERRFQVMTWRTAVSVSLQV